VDFHDSSGWPNFRQRNEQELRPDEVLDYLRAAGFEIKEIIEREPYPHVEHQSRRAYIFARRPATRV